DSVPQWLYRRSPSRSPQRGVATSGPGPGSRATGSGSATSSVGADGLITMANAQAEKLFGYSRKELLGRPVEMLVPERFRGQHAAHRERFSASPEVRVMSAGRELFGRRKDGSEFPVEIALSPVQRGTRPLVKMDLLRQKPQDAADQLGARMEELLAQVRHLSSSVHNLSHQLHPSKQEQLGLVAAIGDLCRELAHDHGLKIEFTRDQMPPAISPDVAVCLYRHRARGAAKMPSSTAALSRPRSLALRGTADAISLRIIDHGRGFDPRQTQGKSGLGLVSMRERVRHLGGEVTIDSQPSRGTTVYVRV